MIRLPLFAHRITRGLYARTVADALSGTGGIMTGGRWHTMGQPIIYASDSYALAQLERLARGDEMLAERSGELIRLKITLPAGIGWHHISVDELETRDPLWRQEDNQTCRRIGDAWLHQQLSAILLVPSAVSPPEWNVLVNPQHPDRTAILAANRLMTGEPVQPDARVVGLLTAGKRATG